VRRALPLILLLAGCSSGEDGIAPQAVLDGISATTMKTRIDYLADDAMQGRILNSPGHDQARDYLLGLLQDESLQPLGVDGGFEFFHPEHARDGFYQPTQSGGAEQSTDGTGDDLVAVLPGSDPAFADQYIVLMAHYDHLGVSQDGTQVFNGAFDDAGGVAMVLEVARAIVESGKIPRRSLLLMITDGEETGLQGAARWIDTPTVSTGDVLAAISIDPVGRGYLPDYWPLALMGAERSPELLQVLRDTAPLYASPAGDPVAERSVRFLARDMIQGFRSDQDEFLAAGIPAVWFTSPGMTNYHQVTDTPDTIDYRSLEVQTKWLAQVVYALDRYDGRFQLHDPPPWDAFLLHEMDAFWAGMLDSSYLDDGDRTDIEAARAAIAPAVAAGDPSLIANRDTLTLQLMFLMFRITREHPGPVPPPFPAE
jgi:Peptidase family M28